MTAKKKTEQYPGRLARAAESVLLTSPPNDSNPTYIFRGGGGCTRDHAWPYYGTLYALACRIRLLRARFPRQGLLYAHAGPQKCSNILARFVLFVFLFSRFGVVCFSFSRLGDVKFRSSSMYSTSRRISVTDTDAV